MYNIISEISIFERKTTNAEESYRRIEEAWSSAKHVSSRIESLLVLSQELRAAEEVQKISDIKATPEIFEKSTSVKNFKSVVKHSFSEFFAFLIRY